MKSIIEHPLYFAIAIITITAILIICAISFVQYTYITSINVDQNINDEASNNFGYMSHYVKIHIYPEREGIGVAAWASDKFPPTTGHTDNNSEVTFPMISTAKYNILIDNNKCGYYIYPVDSYYNITCEMK
jgi:hypothetical protein